MIDQTQGNLVKEARGERRGIDVTFSHLKYSVKVQANQEKWALPFSKVYQTKNIISDASGIFKAGEVSAIMGASGAGKTSLLNLIACRIDLEEGQLWVNNENYHYETFGHFANYVMQSDVLMGTLTVYQTLRFAANLKLKCSDQQRERKVQTISQQLKLQNCMNTLVGNHLIKGISGGEKKRTSIAFELISNPQVIVLDEPTSGLDSLTSFVIIQYLKNLALNQNKTVIMTIHQPNSDIFYLFDRLLLMVEGRIIYQGPSKQSTAYFDQLLGLRCPNFYNPGDYFMSLMHPQKQQNRDRYELYFQKYKTFLQPKVEVQIKNKNKEPIAKREVQLSLYQTYSQLVSRDFKNILRNPLMVKARFFQTVFLYIYIGGLYYKNFSENYTDPNAWQSMNGVLYYISLNSLMTALVPLTLTFPKERDVFLKEESSKMYTTTAYFISRNIIEIPYAFIFPMLQSLIAYWFVGLSNTATQFFIFFFILYLLCFNGMSLGLLLGSVVKDQSTVGPLAPSLAITISLFSGFFKNLDNIPAWIRWIQYISPLRYSFEALVRNEVQFAQASNIGQMNFNLTLWFCIGMLIVLGLIFRCLSLFFLWLLRSRLQ